MVKKNAIKSLNFTITCGGGDGAYLCFKETSKKIYDYFEKNDLDLQTYALDSDYAIEKKIPEDMKPFKSGARAEFGYCECGMTVSDDLELTVEDENLNEIFSGVIPKRNVKRDEKLSECLNDLKNGIYVVGYEGLEDCYIAGKLELKSDFDVSKLQVNYRYLNYELGDREMISSIFYDGLQVDWSLGSYEATGDHSFEFVKVNNKSASILNNN